MRTRSVNCGSKPKSSTAYSPASRALSTSQVSVDSSASDTGVECPEGTGPVAPTSRAAREGRIRSSAMAHRLSECLNGLPRGVDPGESEFRLDRTCVEYPTTSQVADLI